MTCELAQILATHSLSTFIVGAIVGTAIGFLIGSVRLIRKAG